MSTSAISKRRRKQPLPQAVVLSLASAQAPHNIRSLISDYLNMQRNYDRSANRIARLRVLLDQDAVRSEQNREQAYQAIQEEQAVIEAFNAGRLATGNLLFAATGENLAQHHIAPFYDPNSRLSHLPPGVAAHIQSYIPPLLDDQKVHYRGTDVYYYPRWGDSYGRDAGLVEADIHNRGVAFRQQRFPSV